MLSTAYTIAITSFLPSKMCVCGGNIICATCIVFVSCTPYRTPSATFTHWIHIIHNVNTEKCRIGKTTTTTKMCLLQSYIGGIKYTYRATAMLIRLKPQTLLITSLKISFHLISLHLSFACFHIFNNFTFIYIVNWCFWHSDTRNIRADEDIHDLFIGFFQRRIQYFYWDAIQKVFLVCEA